jgi:hypothetical protein
MQPYRWVVTMAAGDVLSSAEGLGERQPVVLPYEWVDRFRR